MYEQSGAHEEHTDRFINYPRSIRGVEVAIFFRQLDRQTFKVGFRSKGNIDVGALARAKAKAREEAQNGAAPEAGNQGAEAAAA